MTRVSQACFLLALPLLGSACNPLIYDKILEDSPINEFELKGPDGRPAHSNKVVVYEAQGDGIGHALAMGPTNVALVWLSLSEGAEAIKEPITTDQADALVYPIASRTAVRLGGIVRVPSPSAGDTTEHAIVSISATSEPKLSRVVRFSLPAFARTDDADADIAVPVINDAALPAFGLGLAAVNLDAGQTDPDYEVMVGTNIGPVVYDDMGKNVATYEQNRADMLADDPGAFSGEDDPEGFAYTLCEQLAGFNGMVGGPFLSGGAGAFVVGTPNGLYIVAEQDTADEDAKTNAVGAPIYDCARDTRAKPSEGTSSFGTTFLVMDFNGDGSDDLAVGDPEANRVFIYAGGNAGLGETPMVTLKPGGETSGAAASFGYGMGVADLAPDGDFSVVLVGAPMTNVDGKSEVGSVHVFELGTGDWVTTLEDLTPEAGTRHGLWAGGIFRDDRDEIVVFGESEGRIHMRIDERDPKPE